MECVPPFPFLQHSCPSPPSTRRPSSTLSDNIHTPSPSLLHHFFLALLLTDSMYLTHVCCSLLGLLPAVAAAPGVHESSTPCPARNTTLLQLEVYISPFHQFSR